MNGDVCGDEREEGEKVVVSFEVLGWYPKRGLISSRPSSSSLFATRYSDPFLYMQKHACFWCAASSIGSSCS